MTKLELVLSKDLAHEAEAVGLLTPEAIIDLIQDEIQRRHLVNQLFDAADRLTALDLPFLNEVEIEAEIQAARHARRS